MSYVSPQTMSAEAVGSEESVVESECTAKDKQWQKKKKKRGSWIIAGGEE